MSSSRKTAYSALSLALALVLPFLTGQIPEIGSMLCPMHFPVFVCGLLCGPGWGLAVGLTAPLLRSLIFSMPPVGAAIPMAFELAVYGLVSGLFRSRFPGRRGIYISLAAAMAAGRIVWGAVRFAMMGLGGSEFSAALFLSGAFTMALPGIALQFLLIPPMVAALEIRNGR